MRTQDGSVRAQRAQGKTTAQAKAALEASQSALPVRYPGPPLLRQCSPKRRRNSGSSKNRTMSAMVAA